MLAGKEIVGGWIHAHEQDQERTQVFVTDNSVLPPSRGRRRLKFLADGSFEDLRPGADDRATGLSGRFKFDGQHLTLSRGEEDAPESVTRFGASLSQDGMRLELVRTED